MKFPRRQLLHLGGGAVALPVMSRIACAQSFPMRPVHLIVSVSAGGSPDIIGRLMAQWLSDQLGNRLWWTTARVPPAISALNLF
jgi:tripartite-type tricarboxylate transporter receptor subunit TctC